MAKPTDKPKAPKTNLSKGLFIPRGKATKPRTITAQLKAAIRKSGRTHYDIGKAAGINPSQIDRFMSGDRGLYLKTAGKIIEALGLELKPRPTIDDMGLRY